MADKDLRNGIPIDIDLSHKQQRIIRLHQIFHQPAGQGSFPAVDRHPESGILKQTGDVRGEDRNQTRVCLRHVGSLWAQERRVRGVGRF